MISVIIVLNVHGTLNTSKHTLVSIHIHVTSVTSFFKIECVTKPIEDLLTLEIGLIEAYKIICGCTMCNKTLQLYCCLNSHLKVHTEEKPYKCNNISNTKKKALKKSWQVFQNFKSILCILKIWTKRSTKNLSVPFFSFFWMGWQHCA